MFEENKVYHEPMKHYEATELNGRNAAKKK